MLFYALLPSHREILVLISQHAILYPLPPSSAHLSCISCLSLCSLLSSFPPLSYIFTPLTLLIPFTGVWLRCCEWVRMAVSRSNPWGLVLIFASVIGHCFSIRSLSWAKIKLSAFAATWDRTADSSATETHCTPFLLHSYYGENGDTVYCTAALKIEQNCHSRLSFKRRVKKKVQ